LPLLHLMKLSAFATLATLFLAASSTALDLEEAGEVDAAGPDPSQVYLETLSYGGSGCPAGTVGQSIADDRTTFTLIFDNYVAAAGPGTKITDSRKNCQLNLKLHFPQGWQYSIYSTDFRGYVQLDSGAKGTQKNIYYFQGDTQQVSSQTDFVGPTDRDYLVHDQVGAASTVWGPCGVSASLNINSQVRIDNSANRNARGQLTTDSADGKVAHIIGFQWRRC